MEHSMGDVKVDAIGNTCSSPTVHGCELFISDSSGISFCFGCLLEILECPAALNVEKESILREALKYLKDRQHLIHPAWITRVLNEILFWMLSNEDTCTKEKDVGVKDAIWNITELVILRCPESLSEFLNAMDSQIAHANEKQKKDVFKLLGQVTSVESVQVLCEHTACLCPNIIQSLWNSLDEDIEDIRCTALLVLVNVLTVHNVDSESWKNNILHCGHSDSKRMTDLVHCLENTSSAISAGNILALILILQGSTAISPQAMETLLTAIMPYLLHEESELQSVALKIIDTITRNTGSPNFVDNEVFDCLLSSTFPLFLAEMIRMTNGSLLQDCLKMGHEVCKRIVTVNTGNELELCLEVLWPAIAVLVDRLRLSLCERKEFPFSEGLFMLEQYILCSSEFYTDSTARLYDSKCCLHLLNRSFFEKLMEIYMNLCFLVNLPRPDVPVASGNEDETGNAISLAPLELMKEYEATSHCCHTQNVSEFSGSSQYSCGAISEIHLLLGSRVLSHELNLFMACIHCSVESNANTIHQEVFPFACVLAAKTVDICCCTILINGRLEGEFSERMKTASASINLMSVSLGYLEAVKNTFKMPDCIFLAEGCFQLCRNQFLIPVIRDFDDCASICSWKLRRDIARLVELMVRMGRTLYASSEEEMRNLSLTLLRNKFLIWAAESKSKIYSDFESECGNDRISDPVTASVETVLLGALVRNYNNPEDNHLDFDQRVFLQSGNAEILEALLSNDPNFEFRGDSVEIASLYISMALYFKASLFPVNDSRIARWAFQRLDSVKGYDEEYTGNFVDARHTTQSNETGISHNLEVLLLIYTISETFPQERLEMSQVDILKCHMKEIDDLLMHSKSDLPIELLGSLVSKVLLYYWTIQSLRRHVLKMISSMCLLNMKAHQKVLDYIASLSSEDFPQQLLAEIKLQLSSTRLSELSPCAVIGAFSLFERLLSRCSLHTEWSSELLTVSLNALASDVLAGDVSLRLLPGRVESTQEQCQISVCRVVTGLLGTWLDDCSSSINKNYFECPFNLSEELLIRSIRWFVQTLKPSSGRSLLWTGTAASTLALICSLVDSLRSKYGSGEESANVLHAYESNNSPNFQHSDEIGWVNELYELLNLWLEESSAKYQLKEPVIALVNIIGASIAAFSACNYPLRINHSTVRYLVLTSESSYLLRMLCELTLLSLQKWSPEITRNRISVLLSAFLNSDVPAPNESPREVELLRVIALSLLNNTQEELPEIIQQHLLSRIHMSYDKLTKEDCEFFMILLSMYPEGMTVLIQNGALATITRMLSGTSWPFAVRLLCLMTDISETSGIEDPWLTCGELAALRSQLMEITHDILEISKVAGPFNQFNDIQQLSEEELMTNFPRIGYWLQHLNWINIHRIGHRLRTRLFWPEDARCLFVCPTVRPLHQFEVNNGQHFLEEELNCINSICDFLERAEHGGFSIPSRFVEELPVAMPRKGVNNCERVIALQSPMGGMCASREQIGTFPAVVYEAAVDAVFVHNEISLINEHSVEDLKNLIVLKLMTNNYDHYDVMVRMRKRYEKTKMSFKKRLRTSLGSQVGYHYGIPIKFLHTSVRKFMSLFDTSFDDAVKECGSDIFSNLKASGYEHCITLAFLQDKVMSFCYDKIISVLRCIDNGFDINDEKNRRRHFSFKMEKIRLTGLLEEENLDTTRC